MIGLMLLLDALFPSPQGTVRALPGLHLHPALLLLTDHTWRLNSHGLLGLLESPGA